MTQRRPSRSPGSAPAVLHADGGRAWAGGQNQLRLLMRGLRKRGVEQLCICHRGSPLHRRLDAEALPVAPVWWGTANSPPALLEIARRARRWDLLHCHDAHALQLALLPGRLVGVPVVASRRSLLPTRAAKWNRADRVIAISGAVRSLLEGSGVGGDRIVEIPSGVDRDELAGLEPARPGLRERLGVAPDRFLVGVVGSLVGYKRQAVVAPCAAALPEATWAVIGEGPDRNAIEEAVRRHHVEERVLLAGRLPDARRFMGEMNALASLAVGEALGTTLLDAMALGVPVVAVADSGPAEVLAPVHRRTGVSLVTAAPHDMARALARIRDEPGLSAAVVAAQRERIADFGIDRTVDRTLSLYRELVST